MALLRNFAFPNLLSKKSVLLYNAARKASYWVEDDMPKPYPKTEKERLEAAKRYGLLPHEYEPVPDDGLGKGDYPLLPYIGAEAKDPYYPWDYPEFKRNFGEVWHHDADILGEDRCDPSKDWRLSPTAMMSMFFGTVLGFFLLQYLLEPYPIHRPVCKKQFPYQGQVHYSFERGN